MDITSNTECKQRMGNSVFVVSRRLTFIALILWMASLALPGLVFYDRPLFGIEILILGWLGPLFLNFAWYANLFFLYACLKLIGTRKNTSISIIIATLLATDAFWFRKLVLDEGGGASDLYGYGFGILAWLVAIFLILIAAGIRAKELQGQRIQFVVIIQEPLVFIGSVFLIVLVSLFSFWGIQDRVEAGEAERRFLSDVVFRVGSVCKLPDVKPLNQIPLVGPLEIVAQDMFSPSELLSWGIPAVRKNGYDYYLRDREDSSTIVARPAEGPIGAKIEVKHLRHAQVSVMQIRLVSADGETVGFSGEWYAAPDRHRMCPGYFSFPKPDEPPRSLLMSTLVNEIGVSFKPIPRGNVLGGTQGYVSLIAESIQIVGLVHRGEINDNAGCQDGIGLMDLYSREPLKPFIRELKYGLSNPTRMLFQVGKELHYLYPNYYVWQASCSDRSVYLLDPSQRNEGDYILMRKRSLPDFHRSWSGVKAVFFRRNELGLPTGSMDIQVISIKESDRKLRIQLAYFSKDSEIGKIIEIVALDSADN